MLNRKVLKKIQNQNKNIFIFSDELIDGLSKALPGFIENALIKVQEILKDFKNSPGPVPDFSKNMSVCSSRLHEEWMK